MCSCGCVLKPCFKTTRISIVFFLVLISCLIFLWHLSLMGYYFLIVHINSGSGQGSDTVHLLSVKRIIEHWLAVNIHLSHTACSPVDIAKYPSKFFYIQGNIYIYIHTHTHKHTVPCESIETPSFFHVLLCCSLMLNFFKLLIFTSIYT